MQLKKIALFIFIITGISAVTGGAYFLGKQSAAKKDTTNSKITPYSSRPDQKITPQNSQGTFFSGLVKKIDKDLGLFKKLENDEQNDIAKYIVYYEAGKFVRGEFEGYTRILAIRPSEGPGPSIQFMLATKDYRTYVLDDPRNTVTLFPESDWENPYFYLDKSLIIRTARLDSDHPENIPLEKPFSLIRTNGVYIESKQTQEKDANGNFIYREQPVTEFDQSQTVSSPIQYLSFHAASTNWGTGEGFPEAEKQRLLMKKKFLISSTTIQVTDQTGLTYTYILTSQTDLKAYLDMKPGYEQTMIEYKKQMVLYNEKKIQNPPEYPKALSLPAIRFTKVSAGLPQSYFNTYDVSFPHACGGEVGTQIAAVSESDLISITSTAVYPLYVLKDKKHPLYELAYEGKIGSLDDEMFQMVNEGKKRPSFEEYVAQEPLVFVKDPWGRWAVVGEYDFNIMGGCGKPVIYLYPQKQTTIRIAFTSPVSFQTQIPSYHNGWLVQAQPDGTLTDLQPQFTNCSQFGSSPQFGSEYAERACKTNKYPYIYWSGRSEQNLYPDTKEGWVISRTEIETFMREKLTEMGLREKEIQDMTSYWVHKMKSENTPYYKIRFFQTQEMNTFIPMEVTPRPDTIIRVFLDYVPLETKPTEQIIPQTLRRIERKGFILVEWGGIQRK